MKKQNKKILKLKALFISLSLTFAIVSCTNEVTPSLYDSVGDPGTPAVITSALSSSGVTIGTATGYAGITEVTIKGTNFATKAGDNTVFFGSKKADILSATTTELVVKAPIIYDDSLRLKIQKVGVENFSNTVFYKLTSAVNDYYPFLSNQEPHVVTSDKSGNIYFSYVESGSGLGVWKITPDGTLSQFAPKKSELFYNDLKYHSDGYLLGVALKYKYAIFKISENSTPAVWAVSSNKKLVFQALDFDKNKNVWAAGKGGQIASFMPDKTIHLFDYEDEVVALRVFNDYLYAISGEVNAQKIVRFPIVSADSLGAVETYFDFSNKVGAGVNANSITFSNDGIIFIATTPSAATADPVDPIIYVNKDNSFGTWYTGLLTSGASSFTWGTGTEMFMLRDRYPSDKAQNEVFRQSIVKIDMERAGAPEFGRE